MDYCWYYGYFAGVEEEELKLRTKQLVHTALGRVLSVDNYKKDKSYSVEYITDDGEMRVAIVDAIKQKNNRYTLAIERDFNYFAS